jgi:hypothetical protein
MKLSPILATGLLWIGTVDAVLAQPGQRYPRVPDSYVHEGSISPSATNGGGPAGSIGLPTTIIGPNVGQAGESVSQGRLGPGANLPGAPGAQGGGRIGLPRTIIGPALGTPSEKNRNGWAGGRQAPVQISRPTAPRHVDPPVATYGDVRDSSPYASQEGLVPHH